MNLSDIQLDIMDYIRPAECKNEDFRSMWAEFEWEVRFGHRLVVTRVEMTCPLTQALCFLHDTCLCGVQNKVAINTNIADLREFLDHIVSNTNMTCLTPLSDR